MEQWLLEILNQKQKKKLSQTKYYADKKRKEDDGGLGVGEPARRARGKTGLCWLSLIMELVPTKPARRLTSVIRVILIFE